MGRTKRIRKRKRSNGSESTLTAEIIALMKWMRTLNWKNTSKIFCRDFEETGRGVTSHRNLINNDVLIEVPFQLLITYSTLCASQEFKDIFKSDSKLGIHDILAAFLVIERHKGNKSFWKFYLKSLPRVAPRLPWFSPLEDIKCLPDELKKECEKCRSDFEDSWERLKCAINTCITCTCCGKYFEKILNLKSYAWGYIMVNTRGVYVDPVVIRKVSKWNIIHDEPQIAMFPLMDMFNHSDVAENKIEFQETSNGLFYKLATLNKYKKHTQIFISYGRHENIKLFLEYGFYLSKNSNDKIKFTSEDILHCLNLKLDSFQFDFLRKHQFVDKQELFISSIGPSFKMKGFLYVALNGNIKHYSSCIFSEDYDRNFLESLQKCLEKLLDMKIQEYEFDYCKFTNQFESNENIQKFLKHRVHSVEYLRRKINVLI